MTEPALEELPERLAEIAEVIGVTGALRLVEAWPGLRLYIPEPEHISAEHPLARQLGLQRARDLAGTYAREKVDIPRCAAAVRRARDRRIAAERSEASVRELAARHQLTERSIWRILACESEPDPTGDLFGDGVDSIPKLG